MEKDTGWKEYFSDDRRYADLINGLGFDGEQLVTEDDLQELDTQTGFFRTRNAWIDAGYRRADGPFRTGTSAKKDRTAAGEHAGRRMRRVRDMVRRVAFGVHFVVIGIENQETIDYSLALRNMSYDVGEYEKQATKLKREVRRHAKGLRAGEYLYGFRRDSRLQPVVTFVLYAGEEEWDGPKSLHGMLDFTDIPCRIKNMVQDYRVNLVEIRKIEDTSVFQTDLRQVFDFIRCAKDREALARLVEQDPYYKEMDEDAYDVVTCYTHAQELAERKDYHRKDGKVDMCTAIREMIEESREEGRSLGLTEGRNLGLTEGRSLGLTEGRSLGLTEGRALGIDEKTRKIVRNMIERGMADGDIMAIAECDRTLIEEVRSGHRKRRRFGRKK